ncbi:hypothetical protein FNV43_RR00157 [Rhamnella rubrinervis]|uniref:Uncharacterized protein n=1 Tax=Rhamnella rubrinervis TaxID=2594499 RepID=A0A8K0MQX6_9ROSA|nr:hypothetical protein FNV43_RR00157 [Rhamnella rubrinervis]
MGTLKMKMPSKAELEAMKKNKRDKRAASKGGASSEANKGEELPASRGAPGAQAPTHDKGKKQPPSSILGLEDSSTIRSDTALVDPIVDSLLTGHDHSILKEMSFDEIGLEAKQSALKDAWYLCNAVVKVNKAYKRKAETYNNVMVANKALEEDNHSLKKTAMNATKRA